MLFASPQQAVGELFTQGILYGVYISTFFTCLQWLICENEDWKLRPYQQMTWLYIIIAIVIFAIVTVDMAIAMWVTVVRCFGDQSMDFLLSFITVAIEGTLLIIIDGVLIYRCWIVYANNWRIVCVPLTFWALTVICAIVWVIWNSIGMKLISDPMAILIIVGVFYTCNFATNVYATTAIVHRVWKTGMASRQSRLYEVCRTITGTGILYSFTSFLTLIATFLCIRDMFLLTIINAINFLTACIAYNLVIIRVGQLRANSATLTYNSTCPPPFVATKDTSSDSSNGSTQLSK